MGFELTTSWGQALLLFSHIYLVKSFGACLFRDKEIRDGVGEGGVWKWEKKGGEGRGELIPLEGP